MTRVRLQCRQARATTESHGLMQLNAYAAVVSELEEDTLGEEYAEAAHAAKNAPSQAKGKGKEKGRDKRKPGGKVIRSKLTIADRKAKLTDLKG